MRDSRLPTRKPFGYEGAPLAACPTGKRSYSTKRFAKAAAKQARKGSIRLRVYECRCGAFHLTSQKQQAH